MTTVEHACADADRLRALEVQHRLTLRVLAVAIEQLLRATDSEQIMMSVQAIGSARALSVWRDKLTSDYVLTVAP